MTKLNLPVAIILIFLFFSSCQFVNGQSVPSGSNSIILSDEAADLKEKQQYLFQKKMQQEFSLDMTNLRIELDKNKDLDNNEIEDILTKIKRWSKPNKTLVVSEKLYKKYKKESPLKDSKLISLNQFLITIGSKKQ